MLPVSKTMRWGNVVRLKEIAACSSCYVWYSFLKGSLMNRGLFLIIQDVKKQVVITSVWLKQVRARSPSPSSSSVTSRSTIIPQFPCFRLCRPGLIQHCSGTNLNTDGLTRSAYRLMMFGCQILCS